MSGVLRKLVLLGMVPDLLMLIVKNTNCLERFMILMK